MQAGEEGERLLEGLQRGAGGVRPRLRIGVEVVERRLGLGEGDPVPALLVVRLRLLDLPLDGAALQGRTPAPGGRAEPVEDGGERRRVPRGIALHRQRPVPAGEQDAVPRLQGRGEEPPQAGDGVRARRPAQAQLVEEDGEHQRLGPGGGDMGDLRRPAVLQHLEILAAEPRHRLAVAAGDQHLHLGLPDVERFGKGGLRGRRLGAEGGGEEEERARPLITPTLFSRPLPALPRREKREPPPSRSIPVFLPSPSEGGGRGWERGRG